VSSAEERFLCQFVQCSIYIKLGNENIAQTYIDSDSQKLKPAKAVIIIYQTLNQIATME
jgi:hypothetical protein